jgi:hypothetical protein
MSNFEKLVKQMRAAQIAYNENPTGDNLNAVEDLEDEVDNYLAFSGECHDTTSQGVKKWLKAAGL